MKIKITETSIEADARELSASDTLAGNLRTLVSRFLASGRAVSQDDEDEEEDEAEND